MTETQRAYIGARIFDGNVFHQQSALLISGTRIVAIIPHTAVTDDHEVVMLDGGILSPGFVDLQVNGGGGVMFNDTPSVKSLATISSAHRQLGTTSFLPTLITDVPEATIAAIDAVQQAVADGMPSIVGLHLEGPHLAISRMGAHHASLIRTMEEDDIQILIAAAQKLPVLKLTIAVESVSYDQIRLLSQAGILLSLGHSDASYEQAKQASAHGVRCVTHLFNAMSQLGNRAPGLVGAALDNGALSAGLIADMVHVHPASIALAMKAKRGPGQIFLVSDAMATAGSDMTSFILNDRIVQREKGRLVLADGKLAGADLDLTQALRNMMNTVGIAPEVALQMVTSIPANLIGRGDEIGVLTSGAQADFLHLSDDCYLQSVWQAGQFVHKKVGSNNT